MKLTLPIFRRMVAAFRERDWFGMGFELLVVVLGVILGLQASRWAAGREEQEFRRQMLNGVDQMLLDYEVEGGRVHDRISAVLTDYARRTAAGQRPPPPIIRFPALERPPTRAWDAMVATGIARAISPGLMFRLAILFDQADSYGDKYQRYNQFTEQQVLPYQASPARFYGPDGKLASIYALHVERLRELHAMNRDLRDGAKAIRADLKVPGSDYDQVDPMKNPLRL